LSKNGFAREAGGIRFLLLSRVFYGVTDLIMGVIVDRTKSRFGKCRPWILRMAIPFALVGVLLFSVPSGLGESSKLVYIFITYNLVSSVVYTAINYPMQRLILSSRRTSMSAPYSVFSE